MIRENFVPGKTRNPILVIVDDEEQILASLKSLLRRDGYKIHFFTSGIKALEFLDKNYADVIISDMRMPEINGTELLEKSIILCPDAIRIIISGYEEKSIIMNAISQGLARHYIMKPWEDDQLKAIIKETMEFQQKARTNHLMEVLNSFYNLPYPPTLHNKLKQILKGKQQSQKEIVAEIEKSTALVAKLLRIANSIFYGTRKPISSVYDAITFVGTEAILNLVLSLESFDNIMATAASDAIKIIESIQIQSIKRAQISREIALKWKVKVEPHEAYIAGLMLDIGLVLRYCSKDKKLESFFNDISTGEKSIYQIDKEVFEVTHDVVGEALLTYWNFSPNIISAVANHHSYTSNDNLTTIVQIADAIVHGKSSEPHDPEIDNSVMDWKVRLQEILESLNISNFN